MRFQKLSIIGISLALLALPLSAGAITIDVTTSKESAVIWKYTYDVTDTSGLLDEEGEGFNIYFDYNLYGEITLVSGPSDWDVSKNDPFPLVPDDGVFDALALVDNAPLGPFMVYFQWLGTGTPPGNQSFQTYACIDSSCIDLDTTSNGTTSSTGQVPEPTTLALMGLGIAGIGFARKKKRG